MLTTPFGVSLWPHWTWLYAPPTSPWSSYSGVFLRKYGRMTQISPPHGWPQHCRLSKASTVWIFLERSTTSLCLGGLHVDSEITQQKFTKDNQSSQWRASWNANEVLMYLVCPSIQYGNDAVVGFGKSNYSITQCNKFRVKESWLFSDFTSKQKFLVFLYRPQWRWLIT